MNFPVINPSIEEQGKIQKFLFSECSDIDSIITKEKKLIELLKEKMNIPKDIEFGFCFE